MRAACWSIVAVALAACGGAAPLPKESALSCPAPGALPFRLQSHGFANAANAALVVHDTRIEDEASDTLGVPGGVSANIYLADSAAPATGGLDYHGVKARSTPDQGLNDAALPGEQVSLWSYDGGKASWQSLGRAKTDADGAYDLPATGFVAALGQPVYAVLEADGSCAVHYDWLWPAGTKFVVFDIDGTLTTSDQELLTELTSVSYTPMMMTAANTMVQDWAAKGYAIVYLTARPHAYRAATRAWLEQLGFPNGAIITDNGSSDTQAYKTLWLQRMIGDFGWVAVAAYGNAVTDIGAYAAAGIDPSVTFIIGGLGGGDSHTVQIDNDDYTAHIAAFVDAQPHA